MDSAHVSYSCLVLLLFSATIASQAKEGEEEEGIEGRREGGSVDVMPPPPPVGRAMLELQSRRVLLLLRRRFSSNLSEEQVRRIKAFKQLEELDAKTQREILKDIEKVKRMDAEDRNSLNRMLTFCGVPKGAFRDKLVWGGNLAVMFLTSSAIGTWHAERDALH